MDNDILYTPEEIALKLKISKYTVYEMIKRGDVEAHNIGRHLRISDTQLENYMLKTRKNDNTYAAEIIEKSGETFARVSCVDIHVNTELKGNVKITIEPKNIILSIGNFTSSARNAFKGIVTDISGDDSSVKVTLDIGIPLVSSITKKSLEEMGIKNGLELYAIFKTMSVKVFK